MDVWGCVVQWYCVMRLFFFDFFSKKQLYSIWFFVFAIKYMCFLLCEYYIFVSLLGYVVRENMCLSVQDCEIRAFQDKPVTFSLSLFGTDIDPAHTHLKSRTEGWCSVADQPVFVKFTLPSFFSLSLFSFVLAW